MLTIGRAFWPYFYRTQNQKKKIEQKKNQKPKKSNKKTKIIFWLEK